jgi:Cu+-exporting ATPase
VVLDKTGTLTRSSGDSAMFEAPSLTTWERTAVSRLVQNSTHPLSRQIAAGLAELVPPQGASWRAELHEATGKSTAQSASDSHSSSLRELVSQSTPTLTQFREIPGCGIEGAVDGRTLRLGSLAWLRGLGVPIHESAARADGKVGLAVDGVYRGAFRFGDALRPAVGQLLRALGNSYELTLLSGDQPRDLDSFRELFGTNAGLHFDQSPLDKLDFIRRLQVAGKTVLMVGDGLNDAGAFQQSDVGVAVVERIGAFSPASDVILDADQLPALADLLRFARRTVWVVRLGLVLSAAYNVVGLSIAAAGLLSPLTCAILMPLSSVTVVLVATSITSLAFRRFGLTRAVQEPLCGPSMRPVLRPVS